MSLGYAYEGVEGKGTGEGAVSMQTVFKSINTVTPPSEDQTSVGPANVNRR